MSLERRSAAPGWYPNPYGQLQWWDGRNWGQIAPVVTVRNPKEVWIAYLLAFLLGTFAAHRFYVNKIGSAIGFIGLWFGGAILTPFLIGIPILMGATIWWIVDLFLIPDWVRESNRRGF